MTQDTQPQAAIWLHSVISLESREQGIRCQAENEADQCNHTVFRKVHVVNINGQFRLYGSTCFDKLCNDNPGIDRSMRYQYATSTTSRTLTASERQLLVENTEQLLALIEQEFELAKAEVEKARLLNEQKLREAVDRAFPVTAVVRPARPRGYYDDPPYPEREPIEPELWGEAKARVRAKHKVDPDLPGWYGLVLYAVDDIRRERSDSGPTDQTQLL